MEALDRRSRLPGRGNNPLALVLNLYYFLASPNETKNMVTKVVKSQKPKEDLSGLQGNEMMHKRVRKARKDLQMTLQTFSEAAHIPISTLKNYELGHSKPTAENLQKLYHAGVNPMWVLLGHEPVLIKSPNVRFMTIAQIAKRNATRATRMRQASSSQDAPVNTDLPNTQAQSMTTD